MKNLHVYRTAPDGTRIDFYVDTVAILSGRAADLLNPEDAAGNGFTPDTPVIRFILPDGTATYSAAGMTILFE